MTTWYDEDYDDPEENYWSDDESYYGIDYEEDNLTYYDKEDYPVIASVKERILQVIFYTPKWKLWNFWNYTLNMRRCPGCDKPYAFGNHDECIPF